MSREIEIDTTILGGLPVTVTGHPLPYRRGTMIDPPEGGYAEDICIYWQRKNAKSKLRALPKHIINRISRRDMEVLSDALMEAANDRSEYEDAAREAYLENKWRMQERI